jgi:hypothetical protein
VSQTGSGGNTTYTAPAAIPSGTTVTITATLAGSTSTSVSASITITPPQPITVSLFGVPPASLQVNASTSLSAQITNDVIANPQVKWTVTCASSSCGTLNPTTTYSEAPTNYTAPSTVPTGNTVTVTATSVTNSTISASTNIVITAAAPTLASGNYVFHLSGPSGNGTNFISGVIVAQGGLISGGEQDFVSYPVDLNAQESDYFFDQIIGGNYSATPDGNLQITIETDDLNVGNSGTEIFHGVVVSASRVLLTEVNGGIGTGTLDLQTSTAAPSGGYAFTVSGVDAKGSPASVGGVLNVAAGGISATGSVADINDDYVVSSSQTLAASNIPGPDNFGRVVFQVSPGTGSTFQSVYLAGYAVDGEHIRLVETEGDSFQGVMGGTALSQGANAGTFSASSIEGLSFVFGTQGEDQSGALQAAGVFTTNNDGVSVNGTLNWNDLTGTTAQTPIAFTGSYTVDATGRVTLSNLTDGVTFNYQLEFYLDGSGEGFVLSTGTSQVLAGRGLQQQSGAFSAASLSGTYAMNALPSGALGPITSVAGATSDALTGFVDFGNGATDFPVSGTITAASNGIFTGTVAGLNSASYTTANDFTFYLVDSSEAMLIETDNSQLTLGFLELQ